MEGYSGKGYAQKNPKLRKSEMEANDPMLFRDWEDSIKEKENTIYNERRIRKMSFKDWKNKELSENLNQKWGFKMDLDKLNEAHCGKRDDMDEAHCGKRDDGVKEETIDEKKDKEEGDEDDKEVNEEFPDHDPKKHGEIKVKDGPGDSSITTKGKMVKANENLNEEQIVNEVMKRLMKYMNKGN